MAKIYRVLVIGTGFATRVQIPVLLKHPRFEVTAVCSRNPERAATVAEEFNTPHHGTDYKALMEHVDLVSVVSEVAEHRDQAVAALQAGKHLLLEKPAAASVQETQEILDAQTSTVGAINHEFRYQPDIQRLKREWDRLGDLRFIEVKKTYSFWADPEAATYGWLSQKERGGGLLGAIGSHLVDMVRYLTGREVVDAKGLAWTMVDRRKDKNKESQVVTADDSTSFVLTLDGKVRARVETSASLWWQEDLVRVYGSKGTASLYGDGVVHFREAEGEEVALEHDAQDELPWEDPDMRKPLFHVLLDRLAARCDGQEVPDLATLEDGLRTLEVLEAIRKQSESTA
ncbi:MAG: Gfo/Idh/MocA family oxidoreductase [Candidatus Eisenbacteria bacterium]|uniref:Gfo/Idh/MocA family oxidoreductase n=1 Tax=Eiseniibacteriota bacterium TaxID=2212470 RepID=A0A7Y2E9U1_UNCEI|nr:Gfo/Idh/MocA family oxidoreductase [Candidatus Eisenbacteria bacterium]